MVTQRYEPWTHTPFENWIVSEGLQVVHGQVVHDVYNMATYPWERTGTSAVLLDLSNRLMDGAIVDSQGTTRYVCDIPAGGKYNAEKHMYEEIFFVLKGRGATTIWQEEGGPRQTFEWKEGSVFSIPLNSYHEIYNGQGDQPARLYAAISAPTAFNLYASPEFVFGCPMIFPDRFDPTDELYFSGKTEKLADRFMETNFIPDVQTVGLDRWKSRGPGSNMMISMAGGHYICHLSEFPAGTYKKAHTNEDNKGRNGLISDVAYMFLSGEGYDLQWPAGTVPGPEVPMEKIDYRGGSLMSSGTGYHQHFNCSGENIRYIVLRYGNPRYAGAVGKRTKDTGGTNVDFEDEDPRVLATFEAELAKRGVASHQDQAFDD
jgi:mannose-6-phosphate isomerase-like protein (cupin superfamily)